MTRTFALFLRRAIEHAATLLTDEDALQSVPLFPLWASGKAYETADRIQYDGVLYRCGQSHTSQDDWTPDATPALWTEVAPPGEIPVWRQPTGAQDAYAKGDKVHYPDKDGPVYESTIDANVYEPTVYGWEMMT